VTTICVGQSATLTAAPAGAASYSIGEGWQSSNTFSVSPNVTTTYPLYMQAADGSQASITVAAVVTVNTPPTALTGLSANITGICNGIATPATLTATGGSEGSGAVYEWGTGGTVGSNSFTATAGSTCSVAPDAAATYWVRRRGAGACSATTATTGATITIDVFPAIEPGEITTGVTHLTNALLLIGNITALDVPIESETPATGGSGSVTYMWVRSGDGAGTLTGSAETYSFVTDALNYMNAGTYYFNRYAQDAACPGAAPVAAEGTHTVRMTSIVKLCEQCCWDGSITTPWAGTWTDCYVLRLITSGSWTGYNLPHHIAEARSSRHGRANTEAITSYVEGIGTAIGMCKTFNDRSPGWYLPAYEELVNMGDGTGNNLGNNAPLNGRGGADVLLGSSAYYWSSTEYYNDGRYSASEYDVVVVSGQGNFSHFPKTFGSGFWTCVWRPLDSD
jgi:hypothetical protein